MRQMCVHVILCDTVFCEQLENYQINKDFKFCCVPAKSFSPVLLSSPSVSLAAQTPWDFLNGPLEKKAKFCAALCKQIALLLSGIRYSLSMLQVTDNMSWDPGVCKKIGF